MSNATFGWMIGSLLGLAAAFWVGFSIHPSPAIGAMLGFIFGFAGGYGGHSLGKRFD